MHLSCPSCASPVDATTEDLRHGYVICNSCDTVSRVDDDGLVRHAGPVELPAPPSTIVVREDGDDLTVWARRPPGRQIILLRETLIGFGVVGFVLGAIACFDPSTLFLFCDPCGGAWITLIGGLVSVFAVAAGLSYLRRWLPPLKRRGERLIWWVFRRHSEDVGDIRQIFVTRIANFATRMEGLAWVNVVALTTDGRRRIILGPLQDPNDALYVESVLDNHLELYDLAVAGESDVEPPQEAIDLDALPDEVRCAACGAPNDVDDDSKRRGVVRCQYCEGLTLLYAGDRAVLLGQDGAFARVYDAELDAGTLSVSRRREDDVLLEADATGLSLMGAEDVPAAEVETVFARRLDLNNPLAVGARFFRRLEDAMGRSGELDNYSDIASDAARVYAVFVRHGDDERPVLGSIEDEREAAVLAEQIREATGLNAAPPTPPQD